MKIDTRRFYILISPTWWPFAQSGDLWAHCEDGASRCAEEFFRNRPHQQFPYTGTAVRSGHKQVNFFFICELGKYFTYSTAANIRTVRKASETQGKLLHLLLSFAVRVLVDGSNGQWIDSTRPQQIDLGEYVGNMHHPTVTEAQGRRIRQGCLRDFGKICGKQDVLKRYDGVNLFL